ncbi:hypothetical protein Mapa_008878 [Marchantia paleacea]|nr:hypothetical protein Mapa_008878 [Marchantia paleacea]
MIIQMQVHHTVQGELDVLCYLEAQLLLKHRVRSPVSNDLALTLLTTDCQESKHVSLPKAHEFMALDMPCSFQSNDQLSCPHLRLHFAKIIKILSHHLRKLYT